MKISVSSGNDLTTVLGIFCGFALVLFAISMGGNPVGFLDVPSVMIVILGTLAVTSACYSWSDMVSLFVSIRTLILLKINKVGFVAEQVLDLSEHAKKSGLLGLQAKEDEVDQSTVLFKGMRMLVDGSKVEEIEPVLIQFVQNIIERNQRASAVLRKAAEIAPAMGLIGTLIGLVQMLSQLEDPSGIGKPMALALLTTLYGALFAYMILTPLASKIERNSDEELIINKIFITGVISIGKMEHPRKLQNMLNVILPPDQKIGRYK